MGPQVSETYLTANVLSEKKVLMGITLSSHNKSFKFLYALKTD